MPDREQACHWCPVHECAWLAAPMYGPPHWHPVPRGMLALALRLAQAGGCQQEIAVVVVPCDRCYEAGEKETPMSYAYTTGPRRRLVLGDPQAKARLDVPIDGDTYAVLVQHPDLDAGLSKVITFAIAQAVQAWQDVAGEGSGLLEEASRVDDLCLSAARARLQALITMEENGHADHAPLDSPAPEPADPLDPEVG